MRQCGMSKRYYEISLPSEIRTKLAVFANLEGCCFSRIRKNMQIASSYITPITPGDPSHGELHWKSYSIDDLKEYQNINESL